MPPVLANIVSVYLCYIRPVYNMFFGLRNPDEATSVELDSALFVVRGRAWQPDALCAYFAAEAKRQRLPISWSQYRHAVIALADHHHVRETVDGVSWPELFCIFFFFAPCKNR
jgi:hypothetical protein